MYKATTSLRKLISAISNLERMKAVTGLEVYERDERDWETIIEWL